MDFLKMLLNGLIYLIFYTIPVRLSINTFNNVIKWLIEYVYRFCKLSGWL
jgi:hypothetical protein